MRIVGIGTDLVEIARMAALLQRFPGRLPQRLLHPNELARLSGQAQAAAWLAKRFATKEAVAKALGTGIGAAVRLHEIETVYDSRGKPLLRLHGKTLATATALGVTECHLSVTDEHSYALAFVVLVAAS